MMIDKKIKLKPKGFYRLVHRDYGELSGQLTFWDSKTGDMELLLQDGEFLTLNIKFVEEIYAR